MFPPNTRATVRTISDLAGLHGAGGSGSLGIQNVKEVAPHLSNACVEWMRAEWNRIALETSFLRSHDQCIEAVKEADVVLCIIDKRYGGCYRGANTVNFPDQNVSFKATVKKIESRVDIVVPTKDLSIS